MDEGTYGIFCTCPGRGGVGTLSRKVEGSVEGSLQEPDVVVDDRISVRFTGLHGYVSVPTV